MIGAFAAVLPILLHGSSAAVTASVPDAAEAALVRELLTDASATAVLQRRCTPEAETGAERRLAAIKVVGPVPAMPAALKEALRLTAGETLHHRRVHLVCGTVLLSDADNWYVPQRLSPEMNQVLETSETPFGRVIAPLAPSRMTVAVTRDPLVVQALILAADGRPLSAVIERYTRAAIDAPRRP